MPGYHPDFTVVSTAGTYGLGDDSQPQPDSLNLAERSADSTTVSLDFHPSDKSVSVHVQNHGTGEDFTIQEIPHPLALDVFHHPYAYAQRLVTAGTFAGVNV